MTKEVKTAIIIAEEAIIKRNSLEEILKRARRESISKNAVAEGFVRIAFAYDRIESVVEYILDTIWSLVEKGVDAEDVVIMFLDEEPTSYCAYEVFSKKYRYLSDNLKNRILAYAQDDIDLDRHLKFVSGNLYSEIKKMQDYQSLDYEDYCEKYCKRNYDI